MHGDYEETVKLTKQVFRRFLKEVRLPQPLVPQLTQVVMEGASVLVVHNEQQEKTEIYIDGKITG